MDPPWESPFKEGIVAFHACNYEDALSKFDEAIGRGGEIYSVYDSRAATFEKLGRLNRALKDSRKVIELAPHLRHGYARSARLFFRQKKYDVALNMAGLALDRVQARLSTRRLELEALRKTISHVKDVEASKIAAKKPHFAKLPVELIAHIFLYATEADSVFPTLAGLVCRHWRSTALSLPALWQYITLSDINPVKKMALWLERSRRRVVGLRIRADISGLQLRDVMNLCGPGFLRTLKFVHCEVDVRLWTSCLPGRPDLCDLDLKTIQLSLPKGKQIFNVATPIFPLIPSSYPSSVHTLIAEYLTIDWPVVTPRLSSLRILIIRTTFMVPGTRQLCALLSANLQLEKLILESGSMMDLENEPTTSLESVISEGGRISLPHLSHLELLGTMDAKGLVQQLSLPHLEHFVLSQSLSFADQVLHALDPLPSLAELGMHKCSFSERRLASFLETQSGLTRLEITHSAAGAIDAVVDTVAGRRRVADDGDGREEQGFVCPLLQHVNFSHCSNLNGGPIMRLFRPRWAARVGDAAGRDEVGVPSTLPLSPAELHSVYIDGCPRIDPALVDFLRGKVAKFSCVYMTKSEVRRLRDR